MSSGASHNASVRWVTCPGCNGKSRYASDNPYRPFCSERCKNHDFGAWASERYRVATKPQDDDESQQIDSDDSSA